MAETRTCKLCGDAIRGHAYTVVAQDFHTHRAQDWKVCRDCFLMTAEATEDDDDDAV